MTGRIRGIITVGIVLGLAAYGIAGRTTYTDITQEENYLDQLFVAEIPEQYAKSGCEDLKRALPQCPIILRVETAGGLEHGFHNDKQRVVVRHVYAGEDLKAGQEIDLCSDHWLLSADGVGGIDSIGRGFVNIMKEGEEYLIFAERQVEDLYSAVPVYKLYDSSTIAPVFSYEDHENIIIPISEENSYVPYAAVKGNEFFAVTEGGLKEWEKLKEEMFSKY